MSTTVIVSLLLDVILVGVLVCTVFYYARRGFMSGLLDLVGSLGALLLAWISATKLSPTLFENFFKSGLITKTSESIQQYGGVNLDAMLDSTVGFLPAPFVDTIRNSASGFLDTGAPDIAQQIVENIMAPLIMPLIGVAVFFVTFLLCRLVVGLLAAALTNVNRIPLMGAANKGLGVLLGAAIGVINGLLVLCAIWAVVGITSGKLPILNEATLSGSFFYTTFSNYNPFL